MRRLGGFVLLLSLGLIVACGSSPAGSPGATAVAPGPTVAPPGSECAAFPTFSPDGGFPSFPATRDPTLEAKFPAQIDGQPVTGIESGRLLDTMCLFGGQEGVDRMRADAPPGIDLVNLVVGSAEATVEDQRVRMTAFRLPGQDGNQLLANIIALAQTVSGEEPRFVGGVTAATAGGKNVSTMTDTNGDVSYLYVSGDTLIVVDAISASQADKIFSAIP